MEKTTLKPKPAPPKTAAPKPKEGAPNGVLPNRFKAEMPEIPGVVKPAPSKPAKKSAVPKFSPQSIAAAAVFALLVIGGLLLRHHLEASGIAGTAPNPSQTSAADPGVPKKDFQPTVGPVAVATVKEMEKPWSARQFIFVKPDTLAATPAMLIRLPGGSGQTGSAYWAFALAAPYSHCDLDFVTSLSLLASRYGYSATHPMLVAACDGTVFDPLRMGTLPSGAYVRGDIVQGSGIRPPFSIHVLVKGQTIIADRAE
jgi:hypothetical protein